jgi:hypothetical protein
MEEITSIVDLTRESVRKALRGLEVFMGAQLTALAQHPHPMATKKRQFKKLTLADYARWWADNASAKASDLRRVLSLLRGTLGVREAVAALGMAADAALAQEPGVMA